MSAIALLAILSVGQEVVVPIREPQAATPWTHSVSARCGDRTLLIEGYGGGRPSNRSVTLSVDGISVAGPRVRDVMTDLGSPSAVYRFEITCGQGARFMVRINRGEALRAGGVKYEVASATIEAGTLRSYSGMEPADASKFWFR